MHATWRLWQLPYLTLNCCCSSMPTPRDNDAATQGPHEPQHASWLRGQCLVLFVGSHTATLVRHALIRACMQAVGGCSACSTACSHDEDARNMRTAQGITSPDPR